MVTTIISYTIRLQSGNFCHMHARAISLLSQIPSKLYCPTKLCAVHPFQRIPGGEGYGVEMKFDSADVCATVVIVACLSYLLWDHGASDKLWANSNLDDDMEAGENADVHEVRDCDGTGQAYSVIVVDLSYSELPEEHIDNSTVGNEILDALFNVSFI